MFKKIDIPHYIFIADLHLNEKFPTSASSFLNFLDSCHEPTLGIYILGDLFETWIGDDDNSAFIQKIIKAMRLVTNKGIPIFFMHGNRDFLIGKSFLKKTGSQLLNEETLVSIFGKKVVLMHGDTLCTDDIPYMRSRKYCRNYFIQKIFLTLPLFIRKKIANYLRKISLKHTKTTMPQYMDVAKDAVITIFKKYQTEHLIHGHTHEGTIHTYQYDNKIRKRIVLGAWDETANALIFDQAGNIELIFYPMNRFKR